MILVIALLVITVFGACSGDPEPGKKTVRVFGAASLTDVFGELETAFEATDPRFDVELNLAGSAGLRAQILDGAPVDVFASANELIMEEVIAELASRDAVVKPPRSFATNRLTIAVPTGNPAGVAGLEDFAQSGLFLGLCAEAVPCGSFAEQTLRAAAVEPSVDTRETDVRALLTKIATGELDAGIVYATDVLSSNEVESITIPAEVNATIRYPIAVLGQGDTASGGAAFTAFVLTDQGQQILSKHGFGMP